MESVILLLENIKLTLNSTYNNIYLDSRNELAHRLVTEPDIRALVLHFQNADSENLAFIQSIHQHFPLLHVIVVTNKMFKGNRPPYIFLNESSDLDKSVDDLILHFQNIEKRAHHRFSWPMMAYYSEDETKWYKMQLHSISGGGAYLCPKQYQPSPGTPGFIRIHLKDYDVNARSEVLDTSNRSSRLPFGFGLKFTEISEESQEKLTGLVNDAIISLLLDPQSEPQVPVLDDGKDFSDPFTL